MLSRRALKEWVEEKKIENMMENRNKTNIIKTRKIKTKKRKSS
jgi:hypothetical protein